MGVGVGFCLDPPSADMLRVNVVDNVNSLEGLLLRFLPPHWCVPPRRSNSHGAPVQHSDCCRHTRRYQRRDCSHASIFFCLFPFEAFVWRPAHVPHPPTPPFSCNFIARLTLLRSR